MLLKNHSFDAVDFQYKLRIWLPLDKYRREADLDQIAAKSKLLYVGSIFQRSGMTDIFFRPQMRTFQRFPQLRKVFFHKPTPIKKKVIIIITLILKTL